jgi:hypothetical protein
MRTVQTYARIMGGNAKILKSRSGPQSRSATRSGDKSSAHAIDRSSNLKQFEPQYALSESSRAGSVTITIFASKAMLQLRA